MKPFGDDGLNVSSFFDYPLSLHPKNCFVVIFMFEISLILAIAKHAREDISLRGPINFSFLFITPHCSVLLLEYQVHYMK